MTEQTSSPAPVETTTSAVESPQPQSDTPKEKRSTPLLGAVAIVLIALASIWLSMRFALPLADRASLGKTGRRLRLFESPIA